MNIMLDNGIRSARVKELERQAKTSNQVQESIKMELQKSIRKVEDLESQVWDNKC